MAATDPRAFDKILYFCDLRRRWFFGAVILLLAIGFNGQWRIEPDGALYLSLARNLSEGLGYTYHGEPHRLAFPGLPYLLSWTFDMFGVGSLVPIHVILWLCAVATLGLVYRLFSLHTDRASAVVVTCITGVSYTFYSFAFQLRNDLPFLLGVLAFLCGWEVMSQRGRTRWTGWIFMIPGLLLAIVMRPAMWALVAAVVICLIQRIVARRNVIQGMLVATVVIAATVAFIMIDPRGTAKLTGDYEDQTMSTLTEGLSPTFRQMVLQNLPQMFGPISAETMLGHEVGPGLNQIFGIGIIGASVLLIYRRMLWGMLILLTVLMILRFLPRDAILPRYFLPVFPLMVFAVWNGLCVLNRRLPRPWDWIPVVLLFTWITINLLKMGEMVIEQRSMPFYTHYKHGRYEPILALAKEIEARVEPDKMVLAEAKIGRILSYFSRRNVVDTWEVPALNPYPYIYVIKPIDAPLRRLMYQYELVFYRPPLVRVPIDREGGAYELRYAVLQRVLDPNDTWDVP